MFSENQAVLRPDINTFVEEAASAEKLFIGDKVFPVFTSETKTGQYPKFEKAGAQLLNNDVKKRAPHGSYPRLNRKYTKDTFTCEDYGIEEPVDEVEKKDLGRFFDAEVVAGKFCMRQVKIGHEMRVASALMNASTFNATAAKVNYTETNLATIDHSFDILAAIERLINKGILANAIVMSHTIFNQMRRSTLFQNYVRGNITVATKATISPSDAMAAFQEDGIEKFLVGRAPRNANKKGQIYSGTPIWGNNYVWIGRIEEGDFHNGGAGRTVVWNEEGGLWVSESYAENKTRDNIVRVRQNVDEAVIDSSAGELITTSYSAS